MDNDFGASLLRSGHGAHAAQLLSGGLPTLAQAIEQNRQTPIATIYKLAAPHNYASPFIFGALPAQAFYVSGLSVDGAKARAAAFYSSNALGVENHILTFYGQGLPVGNLQQEFKHAAQVLAGHMAGKAVNIIGVYFDTNYGDVWGLRYRKSPEKLGRLDPRPQGRPKIWACSCCDSRAAAHDTYSLQANEADTKNVICGFVPSHQQNPDIWRRIRHAAISGIKDYVVTTHSQCGGVAALVGWVLGGADKQPHENLLPWLNLIKPAVGEAVEMAKAQGISDFTQLCGVVERFLAVKSGDNLRQGLKDLQNVEPTLHLHHLDITTRNVEDLNDATLPSIIHAVKSGVGFIEFCSLGDHREELGDPRHIQHPVLRVQGRAAGQEATLFAALIQQGYVRIPKATSYPILS